MGDTEAERLVLLSNSAEFAFNTEEQYTNGAGVSLAIRSSSSADLTVGGSLLEIPVESASTDEGGIGWFIYLWDVSVWTAGPAAGQMVTEPEKELISTVVVSALAANHDFVTVERT